MADQDQRAALGHVALALIVDLGDQRAGGVEHRQAAGGGFFLDAAGHAMGAEDGHGARRHLAQILDENRAFGLQALDHVFVVHDLVADIDRRAVFLQRPLDDLDGAHDAGAKAARLRQIHFHGTPITQVAPNDCKLLKPPCGRSHAGSCNNRTIPVPAGDPRPSAWKHRTLCQIISGGERRIANGCLAQRLIGGIILRTRVPIASHRFVTFPPVRTRLYQRPGAGLGLFCCRFAPRSK